MPSDKIVSEVRQLIADHLIKPKKLTIPLRQYLVREFYLERAKKAPPGHEMDNVLFLNGKFESRKLPQKELIETLIADYGRVAEIQQKLSRMWLAARELMSASYMPKDVQTDSRLVDFLPLWEKVLGYWTSAASWRGWHGHIYVGTVAPLNSQMLIQQQLRTAQPPNAALASAYYSIARLMPFGYRRWECLNRSLRYIEEAIRLRGTPSADQLAIRGSVRLRFGNSWGAVKDFKRLLELRERAGAAEDSLGDAMVHLGFGYLFCGRWLKGRDYLERGVQMVLTKPGQPGVARAKRKLAFAYKLTGNFALSRRIKQEAETEALRLGALDQIGR